MARYVRHEGAESDLTAIASDDATQPDIADIILIGDRDPPTATLRKRDREETSR